MLARLPAVLPQTVRRYADWLRPRRLPAIAIAAAMALCGLAIVASSKMGEQTTLFSIPLHPSQTIEVERALTIWNEPFSADAQHTEIFVSAARRRDVLLRLTMSGLPHRYVPTTADVLEETQSAFLPQTIVDDRRRAGIEGDLVSSLRRINGVEDASVVIAAAVQDPLGGSDPRTPTSASVQLVMQSGAQLSAAEVGGIKRFVAASYPGLAPERVVVVDGFGSLAGAATLDKAASREARLQTSIQSALDSVFGVGTALVRVSIRSAGEEHSVQSTRVTPHGLLEAETGSERGAGAGKNYERQRNRTRYAYDTLVDTRSAHGDEIARISVAVFLDARRLDLSQSKLVSELVRASAGADLSSGDQVVVAALPFREKSPAPIAAQNEHRPGFRAAAAAALSLVVAVLLAIKFRPQTSESPDDRAAADLHATLREELPQTVAYVLRSLPPRTRERVLRAYDVQQRERIMWHLNGKANG